MLHFSDLLRLFHVLRQGLEQRRKPPKLLPAWCGCIPWEHPVGGAPWGQGNTRWAGKAAEATLGCGRALWAVIPEPGGGEGARQRTRPCTAGRWYYHLANYQPLHPAPPPGLWFLTLFTSALQKFYSRKVWPRALRNALTPSPLRAEALLLTQQATNAGGSSGRCRESSSTGGCSQGQDPIQEQKTQCPGSNETEVLHRPEKQAEGIQSPLAVTKRTDLVGTQTRQVQA